MQREGNFKDAVKRLGKDQGWYLLKVHGGRFNAGIPDIIMSHFAISGRMVMVELKASPKLLPLLLELGDALKKLPTGLQMLNLKKCIAAGGRGFVACRYADGVGIVRVPGQFVTESCLRIPGNGEAVIKMLDYVCAESL